MKKIFLLSVILLLLACDKKKQATETVYSDDSLRHVLMPVGGIGTGNILLGGRGEIHELEIFNRAHRDELRPYMTFFSLWLKEKSKKEPVKKILERELLNDFPNGFGVPRQQLPGLPRFEEATFKSVFPFGKVKLKDKEVPVDIQLEAYNPFIPLDVENSSFPVAVFNWQIKNPTEEAMELSLCFNMGNPMKNLNYRENKPNYPVVNQYVHGRTFQGILMKNLPGQNEPDFGEVMFFTTSDSVDVQTRWYRGSWWDDAHVFWDDFGADGRLEEKRDSKENNVNKTDVASISVHITLKAGEKKTIPFYIAWYVPNRIPETTQAFGCQAAMGKKIKNYYTLPFSGAEDIALQFLDEEEELYNKTRKYVDNLSRSTYPSYVIDALLANTAPLKTNLLMRTGEGKLHGFEGLGDNFGCCPGNCTHVWNYAHTMAFLFPSLERNVRETGFLHDTYENGYQCFRTAFPLGECKFKNVAADGQMGNIMRVYREWKLSGDTEWLKTLWPKVKLALEFAWNGTGELVKKYPWMKNCPVPWDPKKEGMLRGDQHNTYDCNFFGPNMMTGSLYLGALKACAEMAQAMNEPEKADEYKALFEKGKKNYNDLLWNGNYYEQKVELVDGVHIPERLKSPDSDLPKYQYGKGCLADQLLGQNLAYVAGLGHIQDSTKVVKTLKAIYENNYMASFADFENVQRVYALNDEAGLVICTWPGGDRELIPFPYADETWTGIEYQVAASLIYAGMVDEGLDIVKAVRGRYAGYNRNPFAEIESGYYYARAMASWGTLLALSGFQYDGVTHELSFDPKINKTDFRTFWSTGNGWGGFEMNDKQAVLNVDHGKVILKSFALPGKKVDHIKVNSKDVMFKMQGKKVVFKQPMMLNEGDSLVIF